MVRWLDDALSLFLFSFVFLSAYSSLWLCSPCFFFCFISFSGSLSLSLFLVFSFLCLVGYSDLLFRGQPRWQWNVREGWCGLRGLGLEVIPWWLFREFCREFYSLSPLSCSGFSPRMLVMVSLTLMAHCGGEERLEQNGIKIGCVDGSNRGLHHFILLFSLQVDPLLQGGRGRTVLLETTLFFWRKGAYSFPPLNLRYLAIGPLFMYMFLSFLKQSLLWTTAIGLLDFSVIYKIVLGF